MGFTTGDFTGRRARVEDVTPPPPPPEKVVTVTLTMDEARILREAAYFYWAKQDDGTSWHNPTDQLPDEDAARVAQIMYDDLFSGI